MTRLCVAIFVSSIEQAQRDIATAAERGADMVELRIDTFTTIDAVRVLLKQATLPVIVTCRPTWEGGQCQLPEEKRLALLREISSHDSGYIDIELAARAVDQFTHEPRDARAGVIISSHDFKGRPDRLTNTFAELSASSADVAKVVWTARTVRDNIEAFDLLSQRQKPTIAICMGESGLISRVLARKFGSFLSFAALDHGGGTAAGQIPVSDMKRLYRWDKLNASTKVYGVVGSPVAHSMSPAIHNAAFDHTDFDGVYLPLLVNPSYESFKAFMESFLAFEPLHLSGLSITIPHKENALQYLREKGADIEPLAERIGAVNTIIIERSSGSSPMLRGRNTDYAAILDSITSKLGIQREQLRGLRVAVIGAGGTGRTAVAALAHHGATVVVYNRTQERAETLADEFNGNSGKVVAAPIEKLCDSCCRIFINATSVGMHPNVDQSPIDGQELELSDQSLVFDTVYNPPVTKFLRYARSKGAMTVGGIEMFVRQAAAQFEHWTGRQAPVTTMRSVVEGRLAIQSA